MCFHYVIATEKNCKWQEWTVKIVLVPRRKELVFQLVPTRTPVKVPMFTRLQKHSAGPLRWSQNEVLACDGLFCFCLSVWLPVRLFHYAHVNATSFCIWSGLHGQNLNLAANQKSRQYFWEHCSCVSDALYIFNLDILSHIITSETLFGFTLYISLVNSIVCDEIPNPVICVCLPIVQTANPWKRKRWIFSDLFKWGRRRRLVKWCNKMILRDDCLLCVQFRPWCPSSDKLKP